MAQAFGALYARRRSVASSAAPSRRHRRARLLEGPKTRTPAVFLLCYWGARSSHALATLFSTGVGFALWRTHGAAFVRSAQGKGDRSPAGRGSVAALPGAAGRRHDRLPHRHQRQVAAGSVGAGIHRPGALPASGHRARGGARLGLHAAQERPGHGRARLHPGQPLRPRADAAAAVQRARLRQRPERKAGSGDAACGGGRTGAGLRLRRALGAGAGEEGQVFRIRSPGTGSTTST